MTLKFRLWGFNPNWTWDLRHRSPWVLKENSTCYPGSSSIDKYCISFLYSKVDETDVSWYNYNPRKL